jgi:hypothetical protein
VSPAKSTNKPGGSYRKARPDLYTVLLALSLLAILVGILFLYLQMQTYNFEMKGGPVVSAIVQKLGIFGSAFLRL